MRDFRDAKAMAQTLRSVLSKRNVSLSHSESLELVAAMLGVADWNTLSAALKADTAGNGVAQFAPGDLVRVVAGPFASFRGIVREIDSIREELAVEVTMFGQPVPIRADLAQLEPR
jgi:transcription antitermination factor NusG